MIKLADLMVQFLWVDNVPICMTRVTQMWEWVDKDIANSVFFSNLSAD